MFPGLARPMLTSVFLFIPQDGIPLAYPSLLSHRLLHHLNHPLFTLVTPAESADSANLLSNFNSLQSDLPNDIFLVTLRSIADKQRPRPSGEALLVLHRLGYDCNFECKCLATTSRGQVSKMFSFDNVSLWEFRWEMEGAATRVGSTLMEQAYALKVSEYAPVGSNIWAVQIRWVRTTVDENAWP